MSAGSVGKVRLGRQRHFEARIRAQHKRQRSGTERAEEVQPQQAVDTVIRQRHYRQAEGGHRQGSNAQPAHCERAHAAEATCRPHVEIATDGQAQPTGAFAAERGFPLGRVFGRFVRPALQLAAFGYGAVAVHGSAVVADGRGIVVAGWSEAGKTETALALVEEGATFLSDKWTLVFDDGSLACFPVPIGVRRWLLRYAPALRRSLPRGARLQFAAAAAGEAAAHLTASLARRGGVVAATQAAVAELATLAQRASLSPSQLSAAYGQPPPTGRAPLTALVLLTTTADGRPQAEPRDPAWAARRLARSATYERRDYLSLSERARYVRDVDGGADTAHLIEDREERHLASVLASARVIEVRTPFPTDPRRIVDAARPLL